MKVLFNHVLIRVDRENDELLLSNGLKLYLDTSYEKEKHFPRVGVVEQAPEMIYFDREEPRRSCDFDTEVEIQKGDIVIFHYLAIENSRARYASLKKHVDPKLDLIPYDTIFVAIREGKVIPVNGYVIVEPLDETFETSLYIPDTARTFSKTKGVVRYISTPLNGYLEWPDMFDTDEIAVGDTVCYRAENCIPFEYDLHQQLDKGKKLFRMQRRDIDAILTTA